MNCIQSSSVNMISSTAGYIGAPDISGFVPSSTFIDYRRFGNHTDLDGFMRGMTKLEALKYLEAACGFLTSPSFDKFIVDYFVNDILNVMECEFDHQGEERAIS